jgi:branched-chain amino acid transport system substrate-binding protein
MRHLTRTSILLVALCVLALLTVFFLPACSKKRSEQKEIKIGCITPLTGDNASYGRQTKEGVDLAVKEINAKGGVYGKNIVITYEDDQANPSIATEAIQKLINSTKVKIIIGGFNSRCTLAMAPIAEKNKVVLISASSTADDIKNAGDYIFRIVPTNAAQGKTMADFAIDNLKARSAAVLYVNDDYGITLKDGVISQFKARGGEIKIIEAFNPNERDFRSQLAKIKAIEADVVFFPALYQECGLILRQAREIGINQSFIGGDGAIDPKLIEIAKEAAENSYYTNLSMGFGVTDAEINAFMNSFKAKYGKEPSAYNAYAYDVVCVIAEALRLSKGTQDRAKESLYEIKDFRGVTGITTFDSYGEVDKPFGMYMIKDSEYIRVQK